jgi:hypothetical protein
MQNNRLDHPSQPPLRGEGLYQGYFHSLSAWEHWLHRAAVLQSGVWETAGSGTFFRGLK